jgi:hypothetical protein
VRGGGGDVAVIWSETDPSTVAHRHGCRLGGSEVGDPPPHKQWITAVGVVSG